VLREEFLVPLGVTQTQLAESIGVSFPRVNEIVKGKRGIAPDTALRLEALFGVSAQFWLNLQQAWDLFAAQHSESAKETRKIRPIAAATR
jgi:addiction module HigA family antidote